MDEVRKQNITLQLDAHHLPMTINADQEEVYRDAAAYINQRYRLYQRKMPTATAERLWVLVALDSAVNFMSNAHAHSLEPVDKQLKEINNKITQALESTK